MSAPQTILLVEDDEAHAELAERAFELTDGRFRLVVVDSLDAARTFLRNQIPAIVIADLLLPDGRGIELLPEGRGSAFPLVVMTSHGNEEIAVEAMKAGALDYVVKSAAVLADMPRVAERALREWRLINARRQAEEEKRQIELRLQHSQKLESLGVLAGGIAHDFNNLVMAIMGHVEIALGDIPTASPARDSLEDIETVAIRASELCHQLLAYSGKERFVVEPVNLNHLVVEMSQLLETAVAKTAHVQLDLQEDLPTIDAAATQIRQIVMNLITNASDALRGKKGIIRIESGLVDVDEAALRRTRMSAEAAPGSHIYLQVQDTGCGMEPEIQEKIFDPFFTTKTSGRGLGMAAVRGIVRSHRGAIYLESQPDQGSTFRILFPVSDAITGTPSARGFDTVSSGAPRPGTPRPGTPKPGTPKPGATRPGATQPGAPRPGTPQPAAPMLATRPIDGPASIDAEPTPRAASRKTPADSALSSTGAATILVIDDDATIRTVTTITLEGAGFLVLTAEDGLRGLERFRRRADDIAVVLLDLSMPEMSGEDTLVELRKLRTDTPVIASSGHGESDVRQKLPYLSGYIQKPYQAERLIAEVRRVLRSHGAP